MRALILAVALALAGCAGSPVIVASPSDCSTLIPSGWATPVPGAPIPDGETIGDWVAFGDAQTAQLDKANGRTADTLAIIGRCEARDAKAVQKARPKFLGIL